MLSGGFPIGISGWSHTQSQASCWLLLSINTQSDLSCIIIPQAQACLAIDVRAALIKICLSKEGVYVATETWNSNNANVNSYSVSTMTIDYSHHNEMLCVGVWHASFLGWAWVSPTLAWLHLRKLCSACLWPYAINFKWPHLNISWWLNDLDPRVVSCMWYAQHRWRTTAGAQHRCEAWGTKTTHAWQ